MTGSIMLLQQVAQAQQAQLQANISLSQAVQMQAGVAMQAGGPVITQAGGRVMPPGGVIAMTQGGRHPSMAMPPPGMGRPPMGNQPVEASQGPPKEEVRIL